MQMRLSRAGFNWILRKPSLLKYMFFLLPTVVWMTKKVWTADKSLLLHRTFTARTQNTRFAQVQIFITCIFPALSSNKWPCQNFTIFRVIKWLVTNEECSAAACSLQHDGPVIVQLQCPVQHLITLWYAAQWNAEVQLETLKELENTTSRFRRKCDPFKGIITKQRHTSDQNV